MIRSHNLVRLLGVLLGCLIIAGSGMAKSRSLYGPVALVNSEYTQKFYQRRKADYSLLLAMWQEAIRRQGVDYQIITDDDLATRNLLKYSALILPGAAALSDRALASAERYAANGGGLLLGGAVGTLDSAGQWRGWDFVKSLAGLTEVRALRKQDYKSLYLTLIGDSPLTLNLPAGLRIENEFYNENYAGISDRQAAYWADAANPLYVSTPDVFYTALQSAQYGQGRVVWFGFNLESMSNLVENQRALLTLIANSVRWLRQEPMAQVALWPQSKRSAVSLTFDCENDFANLSNLLNRLDVSQFRFTFFMLSSMAEQFPQVVRRATEFGEVAIHGDDHSIFKRQSYNTQLQRLARAQARLQALSEEHAISFRPPLQGFDAQTLLAMSKTGIRNFFSDYNLSSMPYFQSVDRARSASENNSGETEPGALATGCTEAPTYPSATAGGSVFHSSWRPKWGTNNAADNALVTFPRPRYDDYDLFVRYQLSNDQAIKYVAEDFARVDKERGLYVLNMHTTSPWGGLTRRRIRVLSTLIHQLAGRTEIWFPTIREVGEWWRLRSQIDLEVSRDVDNVLRLEITNHNNQHLNDVVVETYLPNAYADVKIFEEAAQVGTCRVEKQQDKWIIRIPALQAREVKHLLLTPTQPAE
ncbi:MAG: polysaccharide deacetylase family protein [Acidobacteria bacterium]|nr:polysaccharide deacetylase family protein [Acidobacteriota bacterium]MBI3655740.1 polysaccharide deacetylase family protein [Acidobacteriota bacterium]